MTASSSPPSPREPRVQLVLTAADFDACVAADGAGEEPGADREALREHLQRWARRVVARLADAGIAVEVMRSAPRLVPHAERLYFVRDAAARAELDRLQGAHRSVGDVLREGAAPESNAFLGLVVHREGVAVAIEIHAAAAVDVRNVRARLSDAERSIELMAVLETLPEQCTLGLATDAEKGEARRSTADGLRSLLDRSASEGAPLWLGWSVPRATAETHAGILGEQLEDALVALAFVYRLLAWGVDNDLIGLERTRDGAADGERARADRAGDKWGGPPSEEARPRRPAPSRPAPADRSRARARPRKRTDEGWHPEEEGDVDGAGVDSPRPFVTPPPAPVANEGVGRATLMAGPGRARRAFGRRVPTVTEVDPTVPVERGTRVVVTEGPFAGKVGVVQELDGKGTARVMLGLLAMWMPVSDVVAAAEGRRPLLASSHRKPIPAR